MFTLTTVGLINLALLVWHILCALGGVVDGNSHSTSSSPSLLPTPVTYHHQLHKTLLIPTGLILKKQNKKKILKHIKITSKKRKILLYETFLICLRKGYLTKKMLTVQALLIINSDNTFGYEQNIGNNDIWTAWPWTRHLTYLSLRCQNWKMIIKRKLLVHTYDLLSLMWKLKLYFSDLEINNTGARQETGTWARK